MTTGRPRHWRSETVRPFWSRSSTSGASGRWLKPSPFLSCSAGFPRHRNRGYFGVPRWRYDRMCAGTIVGASYEKGGSDGLTAAEDVPTGPLGLRVGQWAERTKTITEADLRAYGEITGDYNPLHFDDAFARATRFGARVAQGGIASGMMNALVAMDLPGPGTVFMSQSITYRAPAYLGDTLRARVDVISLKPDKPICQLAFRITNQAGELVLEAEAWTYTLRPDLEGA